MDTKTLDANIRSRSLTQLKAEIDAAIEPLFKLMTDCYDSDGHELIYEDFPLPDEGNSVCFSAVLNIIRNRIVSSYEKMRGDQAVAEFIKRVEALESDVQELRQNTQ